jgi:uncharacterized protein
MRLLATWLLLLQTTTLAVLPRPDGFLNDFAGVFTEADEAYLEDYLQTLERDTSVELAVVTVRSLDGRTIEEYAAHLFADWGIGKEETDNGLLLLVATADRAVRIEVGYGLEGAVPDGLAGEIIRDEMVPEFTAGNLPRGIGRGINRLAQIARDPSAIRAATPAPDGADGRPPALYAVPFFGVFMALAGFFAGLALRAKTVGPLLWSSMFGGIPLLLATQFVSPPWIGALVVLELAATATGYRTGRSTYWLAVLRTGTPGPFRDDAPLSWVMGGGSSSGTSAGSGGSDGGGSSSSSGFGGGSSGGGGASGRW